MNTKKLFSTLVVFAIILSFGSIIATANESVIATGMQTNIQARMQTTAQARTATTGNNQPINPTSINGGGHTVQEHPKYSGISGPITLNVGETTEYKAGNALITLLSIEKEKIYADTTNGNPTNSSTNNNPTNSTNQIEKLFATISVKPILSSSTNKTGSQKIILKQNVRKEFNNYDIILIKGVVDKEATIVINQKTHQNEKGMPKKSTKPSVGQQCTFEISDDNERIVNCGKGKNSIQGKNMRIEAGSQSVEITDAQGERHEFDENLKEGINFPVRSKSGVDKEMKIRTNGNLWNRLSDDDNKTVVKTRATIVAQKEGFAIDTKTGLKTVKILPSQASKRAQEVLAKKFGSIQLKDANFELKDENNKAVYKLEQDENLKVFGLFNTNGRYAITIDAESGDVIKTKKPWFDFISSKESVRSKNNQENESKQQ